MGCCQNKEKTANSSQLTINNRPKQTSSQEKDIFQTNSKQSNFKVDNDLKVIG